MLKTPKNKMIKNDNCYLTKEEKKQKNDNQDYSFWEWYIVEKNIIEVKFSKKARKFDEVSHLDLAFDFYY